LYTALAFLLLVWAVLECGKVMWDYHCGYLAGLLYATSGYAMGGMCSVNADTLLSLWELLLVMAYWKAYTNHGGDKEKKWVIAMWFFAGLGFLTKGPPSLLPLLVVLVFQLYLKYSGRARPKICRMGPIIIFLAVGFWWFLWAVIYHPELLSYFLSDEVAGRILTNKFNRNPEWYQPFIVYAPYVIFGITPWFLLWPGVVKKYRGFWRWTIFKQALWRNEKLAFLIIWMILPLIILSLAKSRMALYWMPFFPAAVLMNARAIQRSYTTSELFKNCTLIVISTLLVLVVIKGALAYVPLSRNMHQLYRTCIQQEKGDTVFLAFEQKKLFGLQFYLKGQLTRISATGQKPWARGSLNALMEEIHSHPKHDRYVLVVNPSRDYIRLQKALAANRVPFTATKHDQKYQLVTIDSKKNPG
jgi:4-amino-4-deoxy-L-arabinose transferase